MFHIPAHKNVDHPAGQAVINQVPDDVEGDAVHIRTGFECNILETCGNRSFCDFHGRGGNNFTWVDNSELTVRRSWHQKETSHDHDEGDYCFE